MNTQFEELSRKAATGTLTASERERIEAYLREHPGRQFDVEWDKAFSDQMAKKVEAMPALPGWERTARALQAEPTAAQAVARSPRRHDASPAPAARVLDRLSDWLASTLGFAVNAQAVATALVVVQAGVIGMLAWQLTPGDDDGAIRAGAHDPAPRGPLLRVSFRPDLREAELRGALAAVGGEIVGGPGQIGVYLVRIREGDLSAAAQKLSATGTTELVEVVQPGK
jgi:hypothetical protein